MQRKPDIVLIDGRSLTLPKACAIAHGAKLRLPETVRKKVEAGHRLLQQVSKSKRTVYGVNTGFGYFAKEPISQKQRKQLQVNLLLSHASGTGSPLSIQETRLAMALRLNVLASGHTGVRFEVCRMLYDLIEKEIFPVIPDTGSVGASGDLAPLAHLALPIIGLGDVFYKGEKIEAAKALKMAGLKPITLAEKEGLSLINGTQIMLAVGGLALERGRKLLSCADLIASLSYEALNASLEALNPLIQEVRGLSGQVESARAMRKNLDGSYLNSPQLKRARVQDSYSLRCAPQVHGASRDALKYAVQTIETELNAVTDNPIVFPDQGKILSGGNFHGQPLALSFDTSSMAIAILANISERRLELLLNPHFSGLNAFLTYREGIQSGYMATQYLSASLVNENKVLSHPACTDSIPGNVGIEDFVSMGMTAAKKFKKIIENAEICLALEALAGCQAIDLRNKFPLGQKTLELYKKIRASIPPLKTDRIIAEDIQKAVKIIQNLEL